MIAIGSDHGGVELKEKVIKHLQARGIECEDTGCYSTESCDYPVYAKKVTDLVTSGKCELGILICGTGIGMSMAANKVDGIRAALCHDCFSAEATKQHNNANVLCMGARVIGEGLACKIADIKRTVCADFKQKALRCTVPLYIKFILLKKTFFLNMLFFTCQQLIICCKGFFLFVGKLCRNINNQCNVVVAAHIFVAQCRHTFSS